MSQTTDRLFVYLQDELVGHLYHDKANLSFCYDSGYLTKPTARKLSISLPLQESAFDHPTTSAFFSGLLPDESVRERLANYLGLSEQNTYALLKAIGGECAGAVSLHTTPISSKNPTTPSYHILEEPQASKLLAELEKRPLLVGEKNVRISGAGAQNKLMISFVDNKLAIPTHQPISSSRQLKASKRLLKMNFSVCDWLKWSACQHLMLTYTGLKTPLTI